VIQPLGALVEAFTGAQMHRRAPGEGLPASHDHIDIMRAELKTAANTAGHFGRDQARAGTEKQVVDLLARPAVVNERAAHALDRLLRAVPPALLALRVPNGLPLGNSQIVV
jgi:hypothetical protein